MIKDYFFWFAQPTTMLNIYDKWAVYSFVLLFVVGIILTVAARFLHHPVIKKLVGKFATKDLTMGAVGLIWSGMRYENTPIFAKRFWAALTLLILLVWIAFVLKYFFTRFFKEKREYADYLIKSKYLPGTKR